jgi:hypothetical protein
MSLQVIDEDHYTPVVIYQKGAHEFTQDQIGTRYVLFLVRTFVDPDEAADLVRVHALQDAITIDQDSDASFELPNWNTEQATRLRDAFNNLATANGGLDSGRMFGPKDNVDPVQHLIGTAAGWGGNPASDAYYVGVTPEKNDGKTVYRLKVGDVPVDGFWSISLYNAQGYFQKNDLDRYSLNNVTAEKAEDGSVDVQFGACSAEMPNCLPVSPGRNYMVRLYQPRPEILDGRWAFPEAEPVE